jgi:uncharacterized protein (DUF2126 family)/transglutaminase-like putative cysteine protease
MTIQVALTHRTRYRYDRLIQLGPQTIRLRPAPHCRNRILGYALNIKPELHFLNWQQDPQGNYLARLVFPEKTQEFSIDVDLVTEMAVFNPFDFFLEPDAEQMPFGYAPWLARELAPYLETLSPGPAFQAYLASIPRQPARTIDFLVDLNAELQRRIRYVIRMEPGIQSCDETLSLGSGSCRDTGWLLVQTLRHLGLAARFVSGYLIQLKPDVKPLEGPAGTNVDFTDLHAWCEVYLPGAGWIGLDPTSGLLAGEGHLPLACTPDAESASPVSGTMDACEVEFSHTMAVERIVETPRVTKPYSDEQWRAVVSLGHRVDERLIGDDVRLTVGGEPTFVSIDDMDGEEWNTAADGPMKRALAVSLIRRLRDRFAPNGLLHFGQGKWYPGESLPRWAFYLFWRRDGMPLWQTEEAEPPAADEPEAKPTLADAERLAVAVASNLGIGDDYVLPAYEDPMTFVAREQTLPENVDPLDSKLEDPEERARLARVFSHGLTKPTGFVLPVQRWNARDEGGWQSEHWSFRRKRLFLVPGDAPLGFRLPLGALPYVARDVYPYYMPADPFGEKAPLPDPATVRQRSVARSAEARDTKAQALVEQERSQIQGVVRTALGIEPRDDHLYAFLPPMESADEYIDLVSAIETAAGELSLPVRIEGYTPPADPRVNVIKVTPDPGVIEVNIHPAHGWDELVAITTVLYEEARQTRLGTEKFMLDGRHTGTGGGNHIVLGGPTPPDSPFLRRPDLLRSLVTYWQNHPALSYLFSGLFIGPTSQAPRIDEARHDALHELELAFRQIPSPDDGRPVPPWLVDRVLRNLLVDVTGNTHRAEVCIDKLYSPDGPTGRLGLVEFRAFEMPPHARMSLVQHLLLRSLISWFWREPYQRPLIRWGTALHDKFMLPHFVWQDLADVVAELGRAGLELDLDWFAPHFEFRFPTYGTVSRSGVTVELRQALEPWHVLGEQGAVGGTVRFVDSSIERLQVRVTGMTGERHALTCNGHRLPLHPTGRQDEFVAGVRYRAWQPSTCLHPTIGVHAPLVFDLMDTWSERSLGGCTYHVAHPGGRSYETFPVNAFEAESRRFSRFVPFGHTPGRMHDAPAKPRDEFPLTLDLRWT